MMRFAGPAAMFLVGSLALAARADDAQKSDVAPVGSLAPITLDKTSLVPRSGRLELVAGRLELVVSASQQRQPLQLLGDDVPALHARIRELIRTRDVRITGRLLGSAPNARIELVSIHEDPPERSLTHTACLGGPVKGEVRVVRGAGREDLYVAQYKVLTSFDWTRELVARVGKPVELEGFVGTDGRFGCILPTRVSGEAVDPGHSLRVEQPTPRENPVPTRTNQQEQQQPVSKGLINALRGGGETAPVDSRTQGSVAQVDSTQRTQGVANVDSTNRTQSVANVDSSGRTRPRIVDQPLGTQRQQTVQDDDRPQQQQTVQQPQRPDFPTRIVADRPIWTLARDLTRRLTPEQRAAGLMITSVMLMKANGLGPRERPRRGAELIVPAPARPEPTLVSFQGERRHWVQEGESVSTIARQYGVSVRALLLANPDVSERLARVGANRGLRAGDDVLRLPPGSNPK